MTSTDQAVLEFIGLEGRSHSELEETFPGFDVMRLIRARLIEAVLHEHAETEAHARRHDRYVLTTRGAAAAGISVESRQRTSQPSSGGVDGQQFESLLEQVQELHRVADELTRSPRLHDHVRARLTWNRDVPSVPKEQRELADEVVEILGMPRLSPAQAGQLQKAFFRRGR
jgi:hypothetical protein